MGDGEPGRVLRQARDQMLATGQTAPPAEEELHAPEGLREEIAASWRRSIAHGVRPDSFTVPYHPGPGAEDPLTRAAGPVADAIGDDLDGTGVSLLVADGEARIVDRRVPDRGLLRGLDRISLAPGFRYSEDSVGTSALAIALHQPGPALVAGGEHFTDTLVVMACAAAPITDPRTGRILGAVGLTCQQDAASPLMVPFVKRASREIEQRLLDAGPAADRMLLEHFLRARRRVKGPLVLVSERVIHTNTAAAAIVQPADQPVLWEWASRALTGNKPPASRLGLTSGQSVALRARPIEHGGVLAGALLRIDPLPPAGDPQRAHPGGPATGWASLTGTERSVAAIIAEGATNREAAARLYLSRHTIDFHLRQIFRKLGITSRVELARHVVEHTTAVASPVDLQFEWLKRYLAAPLAGIPRFGAGGGLRRPRRKLREYVVCAACPSMQPVWCAQRREGDVPGRGLRRSVSGGLTVAAGPAKTLIASPAPTTRGLQKREVEPGAGEEAAEQAGPVLHPFEPGLTSALSWLMLRLARLASLERLLLTARRPPGCWAGGPCRRRSRPPVRSGGIWSIRRTSRTPASAPATRRLLRRSSGPCPGPR